MDTGIRERSDDLWAFSEAYTGLFIYQKGALLIQRGKSLLDYSGLCWII